MPHVFSNFHIGSYDFFILFYKFVVLSLEFQILQLNPCIFIIFIFVPQLFENSNSIQNIYNSHYKSPYIIYLFILLPQNLLKFIQIAQQSLGI